MSFELDPREVLMHLHELGYYNITPEQLKEFIKDLTRLIKYDTAKKKKALQKQQQRCVNIQSDDSSIMPDTTEESRSPSPPRSHHIQHHQLHSGRHSRKDLQHVSHSSSESSLTTGRTVLRECEKYASHKAQARENVPQEKNVDVPKVPTVQHKPIKSCNCNWRTLGCKSCDEKWTQEQYLLKTAKSKENLAPRPKSSFIRTRPGSGQSRPGVSSQRCDPVTLYQKYQQHWKQQKLPGENNHNDLRWTIRERMLGQDPQPRPPSQSSSVSSMNRRQRRL